MTKEIVCSGGEVVLVDDGDYELLSRHKWHYTVNGSGTRSYVVTRLNTTFAKTVRTIFMHTMIMGFGFTFDHIDGNTLNNTKANLRKATWQENGWNAAKMKRVSGGRQPSSQYKGVMKSERGWMVQIKTTQKHERPTKFVRLGPFENESDAARAYNKKIVELRGEFAWVNPLPKEETA